MSVHLKIFAGVLIVGIIAIVSARFALPEIQSAWQRATSDAGELKGTLRVGVDSWVGYFPLCSPEMTKRLRHAGYALECIDDKADYDQRFKNLSSGRLDFAVSTVDAYLRNGARHDFPGAIVAVIDESRGGDAIVANAQAVPSLDALRSKPDLRIAYTPASPSEHLLQSVAIHFDLPLLGNDRRWKVEADGSADALRRLDSGKVDVAVVWEPDVSRALKKPNRVKLIGTEDTSGLIIDVLLASRRMLRDDPEAVRLLLTHYFETLDAYQRDRVELRNDVARQAGVSQELAGTMLDGVDWMSLDDNGAVWFGITPSGLPGNEGLIASIRDTVDILIEAGAVDGSPLPSADPYRLTNKQVVSDLYLAGPTSSALSTVPSTLGGEFPPLDSEGWGRLREIGTLKVEPISFTRGTAALDTSGQATIDRIARKLAHYPNFRIMIKGHTGLRGDSSANLNLSRERASAVADDLLSRYALDPDRVRAVGYGSSRPLPRADGESERAYAYRLPRVEVALVGASY